jgi:hypothetical protein
LSSSLVNAEVEAAASGLLPFEQGKSAVLSFRRKMNYRTRKDVPDALFPE